MSTRRLFHTGLLGLRRSWRRPMLWILLAVLALSAFGLSNGNLTISSGDASVGGDKAWINSQFNLAQVFTFLTFLFYTFFVAVAAGMAVIEDEESRVAELLHATPLRPSEYVWGKLLAIVACFLFVLAAHILLTLYFFELFPIDRAAELRGPFRLTNYLTPALLFSLPTILFFAGTAFAVGERTRRPILVMVVPLAFVIACVFFLWNWAPTWLDPRINRLLMLIDPSGFRWLNETWLKLDRGVEFYNTSAIPFDWTFWLNRAWVVLAGLGSVVWSARRFATTLGADQSTSRPRRRFPFPWPRALRRSRPAAAPIQDELGVAAAATPPLASLAMKAHPPRLWRAILQVTRVEARELVSQPGLYLFIPLILLEVIGTSLVAVGAFGTPLLLTSGTLAVSTMSTLALLVCLLLLFYTVESLERERAGGFAQIFYATPIRTVAILFGKALANSVIGVTILAVTFLACAIVLLIQGQAPIEISPFLLVWGLLLVPTFLLWTSFVTYLLALTHERYTTYGLALAALIATGYFLVTGKMTWVFNWTLWSAVSWSDMGPLELDRTPLVLNRLLALSLTLLFTALSVRLFGRRDFDHGLLIHRLHPRHLLRGGLRLAPLLALPLLVGGFLHYEVRAGYEGKVTAEEAKDYWRKNLATWRERPIPSVVSVDVALELEPERRGFRVDGTYILKNPHEHELRQIPMSGSPSWTELGWMLAGEPVEPQENAGLFVFTPAEPVAPGDTLEIGFSHQGVFPDGASKNGGGAQQFVLPSGTVLHVFGPSFLPVPGYLEQIGVDEENRYEPREYPDDYYRGVVEPAFGNAWPFITRMEITAPEEYTVNSVGALVEDRTENGQRTVVWESDHPVKILNVVAGRWEVRRQAGTAIFYHPEHTYNIDEMSDALAAARLHFSEWFYPYPWQELKLSEFPNLATYAQGFPTNITFSEGIGFLTKSDPRTNTAFLVTAHEAAHQWWGNILTPGRGPGGNVLSEGMAHYSTILLMEEVKGLRERIEFCRRIEERYGDNRQRDAERPLVKIDGSRSGDTTVTYDKGGWVMWMLTNLMGREPALAGLQELIGRFRDGPDHALLEDLVETLRPYAPDPDAFDTFVEQWFFDVVVPEYRLSKGQVKRLDDGGYEVRARVENVGSGRMPVEIAVQRGERFPDPDTETTEPVEVYRDVRESVVLGAGEATDVNLTTDFEPQRVEVDPDAKVLQLQREAAVLRL